jgi:hypothetical protein
MTGSARKLRQFGARMHTPDSVEHRLLTQKPVHWLSVWQAFTSHAWPASGSQLKFVGHCASVLQGVAMQWPAWHVSPAPQATAPVHPVNARPMPAIDKLKVRAVAWLR